MPVVNWNKDKQTKGTAGDLSGLPALGTGAAGSALGQSGAGLGANPSLQSAFKSGGGTFVDTSNIGAGGGQGDLATGGALKTPPPADTRSDTQIAFDRIQGMHKDQLAGMQETANAQGAQLQRQMADRGAKMGLSGPAAMGVAAQGQLVGNQMIGQATNQWNQDEMNLQLQGLGINQEQQRYDTEQARLAGQEYGGQNERELGIAAINDPEALKAFQLKYYPNSTPEQVKAILDKQYGGQSGSTSIDYDNGSLAQIKAAAAQGDEQARIELEKRRKAYEKDIKARKKQMAKELAAIDDKFDLLYSAAERKRDSDKVRAKYAAAFAKLGAEWDD